MNGYLHFDRYGCIETGSRHADCTYTSRWSWRFSPTPGRSTTGPTPTLRRWSAFPTPDSCSNWGVLMAPPLSMTSPAATVETVLPRAYFTPVARVPENVISVASARVRTVRFERCRFGRT